MDLDDQVDVHELEVDAEKTSMVFLISFLMFGAAISASISLEGGEIVRAILSAQDISERWSGVSGELIGHREDTPESVDMLIANDDTGSTVGVNLRGQLDGKHYFAAIPFDDADFDQSRLGNISLSDVESGNLFDESDFPIFYPEGSSYEEIRDAPDETFENTADLRVLEEPYSGLRTTLRDGVPTYLLNYSLDSGEAPIFITPIRKYNSCYNEEACNYEFLLPSLNGSTRGEDYNFYMLSENRPVNVTVLIDGERNRTFPFAGRPYNLTILTRDIFDGNSLVNRDIRITEKEGNNLFTPAVDSSGYDSRAEIVTETKGGVKSILFAPTEYSSPENYNLTVDIITDDGLIGQRENLSVRSESIERTDKGPSEKGFSGMENEYKRGVNHLRPIADCLFNYVSDEMAYELDVNSSDDNLKVTRGIPYLVNLENSDAEYYRLEEPSSHLVMFPAGGNDTATVHRPSADSSYSASEEVVFTPTVLGSEDSGLKIKLMDSEEDLLHEANLSVKGATCGSPEDGFQREAPYLKSFKKRVNSIRPVLNSLYVAGN